MLLTSAQVSFAVSSAVVISFTLALFLSGYAIQQRTLRDLRAAIRQPPRPSPKIFLPDRFRKQTTELADGTVVVLGGDDDDDDDVSKGFGSGSGVGAQGRKKTKQGYGGGDGVVVEVKASGGDEAENAVQNTDERKEGGDVVVDDEEEAEEEEEEKEEDNDGEGRDEDDGGIAYGEKEAKLVQSDPKWEPWKAQKGAKDVVRDNSAGLDLTPSRGKAEKPISRAERRRRIKAEIQRLAQGDTPIYYQRRLW